MTEAKADDEWAEAFLDARRRDDLPAAHRLVYDMKESGRSAADVSRISTFVADEVERILAAEAERRASGS